MTTAESCPPLMHESNQPCEQCQYNGLERAPPGCVSKPEQVREEEIEVEPQASGAGYVAFVALQPVFLELAIQRGFADAEHARRYQLIAFKLLQRLQDCFFLQFGNRHNALLAHNG